jgi:hypothetical protein
VLTLRRGHQDGQEQGEDDDCRRLGIHIESESAADTAWILFFSFFRLYHKTNLINS